MAKTWTIVILTDEDTVEAVPSNWIQNNKCYWPLLTFEKLTAAIKNHEEPNISWPSYPIRIVRNGSFANYSTAKEKCRKAEFSSDITSDFLDTSLANKRKVTRKTYGSSFEENISSSSDDNNNVPTKLPTPPRLTNDLMKEKCCKAEYLFDINSNFLDRSLGNKRKATKTTYGTSFEENISSSSDDNNKQLPTKLPAPARLTNETNTFTKIKLRKKSEEAINDIDRLQNTEKFQKNSSKSNDNYFKEIIRQQNMLKARMWQYTDCLQDLTTSINHFLTNDRVNQLQNETSFLRSFDFPLQNEEDLIRVDEHLNDEKNFNVAVNELLQIGGSSVYNITQRVLQMLITNELATSYSWLGRRSKKVFNKLKIADLIIGSIKKTIPNSTNKDCEESIKKWLRRAKKRNNNKKTLKILMSKREK